MSYFIPSSIQKRLLRYVLSRLELLDTDALDLDRLDIEWGRNSTVELRDVGLRKARLSSLLDLPDSLKLVGASIALLRVTVPADIHTSSIIIEVDGVEATIKFAGDGRVASKSQKKPQDDTRGSPRNPRSRTTFRSPTRRPSFIPEASLLSSDDGEDTLPSPHNLAASFLAEGIPEDKEELEAAWNSHSVDLQQSVRSAGKIAEESDTGLGVGMGLPAFLAAFLRGIGDRLQVKIKNVTVKAEVELEASSDGKADPLVAKAPGLTTVTFHMDRLDVCEVDATVQGSSTASTKGRSVPITPLTTDSRLGKRRVILHKLWGSIASESDVFSPLSGLHSKETGVHVQEQSNKSALDTLSQSIASLASDSVLDDSSIYDSEILRSSDPMLQSLTGFGSAMNLTKLLATRTGHEMDIDASVPPLFAVPSTSTGPGRTTFPATEVRSDLANSSLMAESMEVSQDSSTDFGESYSQHLHSALKSFRDEKSSSTSQSYLRHRGPHSRNSSPTNWSTSPPRPQSPSMRRSRDHDQRDAILPPPVLADRNSTKCNSSPTHFGEESPSDHDHLNQSMLFSHDQAESIYMSALTEEPILASKRLRVPGGWDDASYASLPGEKSVQHSADTTDTDGCCVLNVDVPGGVQLLPMPPDLPDTSVTTSYQSEADRGTLPFKKDEFEKRNVEAALPSQSVLARKFFEVDTVELWLPKAEQAAKDEPATTSKQTPLSTLGKQSGSATSAHQSIPGSFSLYAESKAIDRRSLSTSKGSMRTSHKHKPPAQDSLPTLARAGYELLVGSVRARTDVATSRLFVDLFRRARIALDSTPARPQDSEKAETEAQTPGTASTCYSMYIQSIALQFLEVLEPELVVFAKGQERENLNTDTNSSDGVLFVLNAQTVDLAGKQSQLPEMKLEIGKLSVGFNDQEIISFGKEARLRTSVRDLNGADDKDVCVHYAGKHGYSDVHINTQALNIKLDLQRLDNTLGSLGGLSGLIELGSSIASESTATPSSPKAHHRSRTVHFETLHPRQSEESESSQSRVNVRLSGAALSLQGKDCNVKYHSSAIKMIGRGSLFGLQIDDIRLSGPYGKDQGHPGIEVRLRDTSIKYLCAPEEHDLTRLISLLTPSKDKFEDDDDLLVDTMIRQRKKGSVLRTNIAKLELVLRDVAALQTLQDFAQETSKLSAFSKYLPEESRPGLMTLGLVEDATCRIHTGHTIGVVSLGLKNAEFAHISFPSLIAISLGKVSLEREEGERMVCEVLPLPGDGQPPMLMARMIGDELEPVVKVKLWNVCFEYSIPLAMAMLDLNEDATREEFVSDLTSSIAGLVNPHQMSRSRAVSEPRSPQSTSDSKPVRLNIALRDCAIGLTPRSIPSKALFVLTDAQFSGGLPDGTDVGLTIELRKASLLIIDDSRKLTVSSTSSIASRNASKGTVGLHIPELCDLGFVSVSAMSAATIQVNMTCGSEGVLDILDVEFKDELFVLETCADSTQTLAETLSGLAPPMPTSKGAKYRTEIAPMEHMMASFTGDAFAFDAKSAASNRSSESEEMFEEEHGMEFVTLNDFDDIEDDTFDEGLFDYTTTNSTGTSTTDERRFRGPGLDNRHSSSARFSRQPQAVGKKWDSANNRYIPVSRSELDSSPVQVRIRDLHIIWNLYDGYDWEKTRDVISKAVHNVAAKAEERRVGRRIAFDEEEEKDSVIGDFLFNSIYIGIPVNHDPQELTRQINRNLDDVVSDTASHTSTANSRPSSSHRTPRSQSRKLKLERSKRHKVAFELRGVSADFFAFAPGAETQSSTDVRITDFEIFDHVPTSTWKKFATYMRDAGPREARKPMVHLEICNVRPVPELEATELVLRVTVLPVRLHVDQDALDFITRFFDFKDDTHPANAAPTDQPYLQRVEVRAVPLKLDYKPKKVDYAGIRSGRTNEFMNFFILDGADMVLKHTIIYGTSGFQKLHKSLEDVWMPDITRNQLPSVLSGLNGVRTLVNVGSGIRDLVVIPVREYRKDGRIVRSISKGATAFAKQTGGELTRFGAKLAIGAQTALQGAEDFFVARPGQAQSGEAGWADVGDEEHEERRAISHYANQPTGILQGLKGAARSLERDLLVTKDIIIAISGEARESGSAEGAARAVARHAPTLILRPMIGATKAISQTLMGATNTVDPQNRRRVEDKYKRY